MKPDILQTLSREGIEVTRNKAHCPFHQDDTPSFMVYPANNSWYCFGCSIGGDVIDFIQRHRGLSYHDAVTYLGVEDRKPCKRDILRRDKIKEFKEWEKQYHSELACQYRTIQNHKSLAWDMDDIDAGAYHAEPLIIHRLDILEAEDNAGKLRLREEVLGG